MFGSWRKLASLLQEFCLFKLESIRPICRANKAYGIGTQQIQVGDVMIPLWSPELRPDRYSSLLIQEQRAIHIRTMLAVRRTGGQPPQHTAGIPNDREQVETGRIIGSAVSVLLERDWNHDCLPSVDTNLEDCTKREQRCLMQLNFSRNYPWLCDKGISIYTSCTTATIYSPQKYRNAQSSFSTYISS